MRMKRPGVITKCVADGYAMPGERIIEFTFPSGKGGLISFDNRYGMERVHVYNLDKGVKVLVSPENLHLGVA